MLQNSEPSPDHFLTMSPPPTKRQICQIRPPYSQTAGLRFDLQRYRFITSTTAAATTAPSSTIAPPTPSVSLRSHFSSSAWSSSTEGWLDTGRRWVLLAQQRARNCWETERLVCLDHVWADDAIVSCQRLLAAPHCQTIIILTPTATALLLFLG